MTFGRNKNKLYPKTMKFWSSHENTFLLLYQHFHLDSTSFLSPLIQKYLIQCFSPHLSPDQRDKTENPESLKRIDRQQNRENYDLVDTYIGLEKNVAKTLN